MSEAADWFLLLRENDVSESDLAAWFEWCADAENLKEFERIGGVWRGFGQFSSDVSTMPLPRTQTIEPTRHLRLRWVGWAAAVVVLAAAATILAPWRFLSGHGGYVAPTAIQSDDLADGSRVTLAPRSAVSVDFSGSARNVSMSAGEVFFRVHPDKRKPFIVTAGGVSVTAVGTAFDVKSEGDTIAVTVQEGTVDVAPGASGGDGQRWRITRGSQLIYDRRSASVRIAAVEADRIVAWHSGRLEYVAVPLAQVVADVSRYSPRQVEIGDPRLSTLTFTGAVLTSSVDDWLAAIQSTFSIRVVTADDGHLVLISRTG